MGTWVEKHPYKMALFVCIFVSMFALAFHYQTVNPHDWQGLFMWLPALWVLPVSAAAFSSIKRGDKDGDKNISK